VISKTPRDVLGLIIIQHAFLFIVLLLNRSKNKSYMLQGLN